jgi:hypothetical protein
MDRKLALMVVLVVGLLGILAWGAAQTLALMRQTAQQAVSPVQGTVGELGTQVAKILHPTPTVIPDPVTIVHEVRSLARLETIQYSVEKVVTADSGQEFLKILFGDRLLLVAHGVVIAGVDLEKLEPQDLWVEDGALYVRLPPAEIFIATLDNEKSYIYDRQVGFLTRGNVHLETAARQAAERAIRQSALEDGILEQARRNAQAYLDRFLRSLGFATVIFVGNNP